jgi:hypothetical protein
MCEDVPGSKPAASGDRQGSVHKDSKFGEYPGEDIVCTSTGKQHFVSDLVVLS